MPVLAGSPVRRNTAFSLLENSSAFSLAENSVLRELRAAVPIIDAAVYKIVRLTGGFCVRTGDEYYDKLLADFVRNVVTDAGSRSLQSFVDTYFEQLLCYGTAVGEMLTDEDGRVVYLYNAPLESITLVRDPHDFRTVSVCRNDGPIPEPVKNQERIVYSTLNAKPGSLTGTPLLNGLPFVSSVLVKIFNAVGANWDRVGNIRFAVTYKPDGDGASKAFAKERAMQIAEEWGNAMKSSEVRDFIAVGDVSVKVIGADNQILDSEVPVRQLMEQIVAKLSLPPFMLGLSWSTTERMSQQQADALTTELEHYRRILTPVIEKICSAHLRAYGCTLPVEAVWDDIMLKDTLDEANAAYLNAKTQQISMQSDSQGGEK